MEYFPFSIRYGSANVNIVFPAAIETYWVPLTRYEIGPATTCPPTAALHNCSPVRALSA